MKTALKTLIDNLQLELNGMGVMQYNITNKIELQRYTDVMKAFEYCISEAKNLLDEEKNQIFEAVNSKYENLNITPEQYYLKKFESCNEKT